MPTITATIEIDCPEGYEPVAFRVPKRDEHFVTACGEVEPLQCNLTVPRLILRPVWQPAAWMPKEAWLYPHCGRWYFSRHKPMPTNCGFGTHELRDLDAERVAWLYGETFVPPPTREPVQIK